MLAKAFPDATVVDGEQFLRRARSTKLPAEVDAIRASIGIAERALAVTLDALAPGVTERQLTGVFMEAMASQGVTTPATQDVAWITSRSSRGSGPSRDTPVADGDLVAFDAAVISDGYFGELSRTVVVGEPTPRRSGACSVAATSCSTGCWRHACRARRRAICSTPTPRPASTRRPCRSPAGWATASTCRS